MESEFNPSAERPSSVDAAEQLRSHEELRAQVESQAPSRTFALLGIWGAAVLGAYVAVFLFSVGGRVSDEEGGVNGFSHTAVLLAPVLVFTSLLTGARERYSIRKKPSPALWVGCGIAFAGFVALGTLSVAGVSYPSWLNLVVAGTLFGTLAASPVRQLRSSARLDRGHPAKAPLSRPVRWTTALIGVALGILAVTVTMKMLFSLATVAVMLVLVAALIGSRAAWGLPRTGYEWGGMHWAAFGLTLSILFALGVLLSRTDVVSTPVSIVAGGLVVVVMVIASRLPVRVQQA